MEGTKEFHRWEDIWTGIRRQKKNVCVWEASPHGLCSLLPFFSVNQGFVSQLQASEEKWQWEQIREAPSTLLHSPLKSHRTWQWRPCALGSNQVSSTLSRPSLEWEKHSKNLIRCSTTDRILQSWLFSCSAQPKVSKSPKPTLSFRDYRMYWFALKEKKFQGQYRGRGVRGMNN